jgi:chromate transporter
VIPGRWFVRHRNQPRIRGFVKGATAAAVGGIAGASIVLGRQAITDLPTLLITLASLAFLWRIKSRVKEPLAVLAAGAAGLALHGIYRPGTQNA